MIQYIIQFELYPDKEEEFFQSWNSFRHHTEETEGLDRCDMNKIRENQYEIRMNWSEKYYLNMYLDGDWNNFLHGAISVLGSENLVTQKTII